MIPRRAAIDRVRLEPRTVVQIPDENLLVLE
jgi:hypothetical protein